MRSVGLDLGARHIAFCEVVDGVVTRRGSVRRLSELEAILGPDTAPARVAFEACREGWHVHDTLLSWGKEALMLDTTRIRRLGVGHHGRKNDALDAEAIALALDAGRIPLAHVLSPERRALRAKLSVRGELVEMRARQVTVIRGLVRAKGQLLPTCATASFVKHVEKAKLDAETRALISPLLETLRVAEEQIAKVDAELVEIAKADPIIMLLATAPGIGPIVAARGGRVRHEREPEKERERKSQPPHIQVLGRRAPGTITKSTACTSRTWRSPKCLELHAHTPARSGAPGALPRERRASHGRAVATRRSDRPSARCSALHIEGSAACTLQRSRCIRRGPRFRAEDTRRRAP